MLWTVLMVLLALWVMGYVGNIGGRMIHILLFLALILLVFNLTFGRRTV